MSDWQVTATKIYCEAVDEDVTIMVYSDWSTRCSGYQKYVKGSREATARMFKIKSDWLDRNLRCEGPEDYRITRYRDELIAREKAADT